jgi:hypothetical protein
MASMVVVTISKGGISMRVMDGSQMVEEVWKPMGTGILDCVRGNFEDEDMMTEDLVCAMVEIGSSAAGVMAALGV